MLCQDITIYWQIVFAPTAGKYRIPHHTNPEWLR